MAVTQEETTGSGPVGDTDPTARARRLGRPADGASLVGAHALCLRASRRAVAT
jgi:hypothetical protein